MEGFNENFRYKAKLLQKVLALDSSLIHETKEISHL